MDTKTIAEQISNELKIQIENGLDENSSSIADRVADSIDLTDVVGDAVIETSSYIAREIAREIDVDSILDGHELSNDLNVEFLVLKLKGFRDRAESIVDDINTLIEELGADV